MEHTAYDRILCVDPNASQTEIRRAYRRVARQLYLNMDLEIQGVDAQSPEPSETVEVASEVRGYPGRRAERSRFGSSWQQWQRTGHDSGHNASRRLACGSGRRKLQGRHSSLSTGACPGTATERLRGTLPKLALVQIAGKPSARKRERVKDTAEPQRSH